MLDEHLYLSLFFFLVVLGFELRAFDCQVGVLLPEPYLLPFVLWIFFK
jgi:hypothetical protein